MARSNRIKQASRQLVKMHKQAGARLRRAEKSTGRHFRRFLVRRWERLRSSRKWIAGWLGLVAVLIGATTVQFIWFQQGYQVNAPAYGGTYVEGTIGAIDTLNPLYASTRSEKAVQKLVFSSLYRYDEGGTLQPDLAQTVSASGDARTFTVKLREDVKWHDGEKLTADDVVYTVDLMRNEDIGSSLGSTFYAVEASKIDDFTVKFDLGTPYSMFQHAMTFAVLPSHILKDIDPLLIRENEFSYHPIGTGPFEMKLLQTISAERGEKTAHLVANDSYYAGRPYLNRYEVHSYSTQDNIRKALENTEINATTDLSSAQGVDTKKYTVDNVATGTGVFAIMNTTDGVLRDAAVRRALRLATDTDAIQEAVGRSVKPMHIPFMKSRLYGGSIAKAPAADIKKAGQQLERAGWVFKKNQAVRTKKGKTLEIDLVIQKGSQHSIAANALVEQWQEVGAKVEVTTVDSSQPGVSFTQDYLRPRQYDVLLYDLLVGADLDSYPYWHSSQANEAGLNFANYSSVVADEAIVSARLTTNPALRRAKARAFAKQWVRDAPAIGLYQKTIPYIHSRSIRSLDPSAELVSINDQYGSVASWYMKERSVYRTP